MKLIPLTRGYSAMVDDEDFEKLNKYKWSALKTKSGFYAYRSIWNGGMQKHELMHRMIIGATAFKDKVDHANGDTLDNTRLNLRICTNSQNCQNRGKTSKNTSGEKGVFKSKGKWRAAIAANGTTHYLGTFDSVDSAAAAYKEASIRIHGDFSRQ